MDAIEFKTREEWLAERRKGIGGSDAASAVGLSKWRTPYELWLDKRGELQVEENEPMRWGNLLEPLVRQEYANRTGRTVVVPNKILRHQRVKFALLNADGIADENRLYEGKTARTAEDWGEPGTDEIPQEYLLQVQHGLFVTGFAVCDVAVLIGGSDFRLYTVEADRELQEILIDQEADFWSHVETGDPPDPVNREDAELRWRITTKSKVFATDEVAGAAAELADVKSVLKQLEQRKDELQWSIQSHMKDACELVDVSGKTLATWKNVTASQRFDLERFIAEQPELYRAFLTEAQPHRRFLLKGSKS